MGGAGTLIPCPSSAGEHNQLVTDSPWTFEGESASLGGHDTVTMVDGTTFMVCARSGDVFGSMSQGLFMLDTRVLSHWGLRVNASPVQPLAVTPNGPFSATFVGRIDDPFLADASVTVIQRRHVGRGMREDLEIRNHGATRQRLQVELDTGADFGSSFDVKAGKTSAPGPEILGHDQALDVDAIVIGWSQDPFGGRATTLWQLLRATTVPLILVPVRVPLGLQP